MDQQLVIEQLNIDLDIFGVAYYTIDQQGNKTRIDPLCLVTMKNKNGTIEMEAKYSLPTKPKQ